MLLFQPFVCSCHCKCCCSKYCCSKYHRCKFGLSVLMIGTLLLFVISGCAQQSSRHATVPEVEVQRILSSSLLLADANPALMNEAQTVLSQDPLAVNAEMRRFIRHYVSSESSANSKLQQLVQTLLHGGMLGVSYNPQKTYSAEQTFYYQEGNCLSFSMLMVALGREVGLKVWFNEVQVPPTWDMQSERTQVNYRHMNVVVKADRRQAAKGDKIIDINMSNYSVDYAQRRVSDDYAVAQFYNNLAMESLIGNELAPAFLLLRAALDLEPELSFLWGNLGTLYRRAEHFDEAEVAYLKGLQLDAEDLMIVSNLGRLYRQMDNPNQAEYYDQLAARYRANNPYYRYAQAEQAFASRQFNEALESINEALESISAAIEGYTQDHRFYFLAAEINSALGQTWAAQRQLQKAISLRRDDDLKRRYQERLAEITRHSYRDSRHKSTVELTTH